MRPTPTQQSPPSRPLVSRCAHPRQVCWWTRAETRRGDKERERWDSVQHECTSAPRIFPHQQRSRSPSEESYTPGPAQKCFTKHRSTAINVPTSLMQQRQFIIFCRWLHHNISPKIREYYKASDQQGSFKWLVLLTVFQKSIIVMGAWTCCCYAKKTTKETITARSGWWRTPCTNPQSKNQCMAYQARRDGPPPQAFRQRLSNRHQAVLRKQKSELLPQVVHRPWHGCQV